MDIISYILGKKYTDNSISGISGVLAGKNCTISSVIKTDGVTTITFKWTADNGTENTTDIQVADGETPTIATTSIVGGTQITFTTDNQTVTANIMDGEDGVGVSSATINNDKHLILTFTDATTIDCGSVISVEELNELDDVNVDTATLKNGQILVYDSTTHTWKNGSPNATSTSVEDLSDVTITSITDGQILKYDAENEVWVNADGTTEIKAISDIEDVNFTSLTDGQFIKYDATTQKWINITLAEVAQSGEWNDLLNIPTTISGYGITDVYTKTETDTLLENKADSATTLSGYGITDAYTKTEIDTTLEGKADEATTLSGYGITDAYTKTETDTLLTDKANNSTTLSGYGITDAYTKTETDTLLTDKADNATTLSGYGITDAYTKTETNTLLDGKADSSTTLSGYGITDAYTKTEVDTALADKADSATTLSGYGITDAYTKTEADNIFSTFSGSYNDLINKPTIPTSTSQLINDSDFVVDNNYVHTDNNFTTTLKTKLDGIASGAEVNIQSDWNETDTTSDAYIANKPTIPNEVTVDSALSTSSTNPVQNKIITNALANKVDDTDLAIVAKSGSYNDLSDKPTIPSSVTVDSALSSTSTNPVQNKVITSALGNKADSATTLVGYGITDAYTKTEVDSALTNKADKATTIAGYGITNAYTKEEVDSALTNKADKATTLAEYGIADAYTKTETDSAITTAIEALDITDSATAGSYVTTVSEADGKISVTKEAADVTPTALSTKMVTSDGIKTYVDDSIGALDVTDTAVSGSYITAVSETDGVIAVTREASDTSPTDSSNKLITSGGVYSALNSKADSATTLAGYGINDAYTKTQTDNAISTAINALDVSDSAVSGSYVTAVNETDGNISVTREAADTTPTASSTKMVTSGGVKTAIDNAINALDVADTVVSGKYITGVSETNGKISVTREKADTTPTDSSTKMVTSGGVYTALSNKQNTLTFDTAPTSGSTKPVTSGGIYSNTVSGVSGTSGANDGQVKISITKNGTTTTSNMTVTSWDSLVGKWTSTVSALTGATTASFTNPFGVTSISVDIYYENSSNTSCTVTSYTVTTSTITVNFDALSENTNIKLLVRNLS